MDFLSLVIILIVVGSTVSRFTKQKKKAANTAPGRRPDASASRRGEVSPPPVVDPSFWGQVTEFLKDEGEDGQEKQALDEGESVSDPEGCVGGSIAHGEHSEQPAPRALEELPKRPRPALQAAQACAQPRAASSTLRLTPESMRQAVLMSEILDRPVAMRRGRSRR